MKGHAISYTPDQLAWIEANATRPRREAHAEFCQRFDRCDVSLTNYNALCKRNGWMTGRTGQFHKGQDSWNKGKPMPFNANSARTRFQPGSIPANRKPLWSERVGKDGYVEISVPERNPYTGHSSRYVQKHRWLWEQANGPVPEGHALKCLDGDKTNCDPSNWEALPRALLPRLNGRFGRNYDTAPAELKPTILAIAKLEHAAREKTRESAEVDQ